MDTSFFCEGCREWSSKIEAIHTDAIGHTPLVSVHQDSLDWGEHEISESNVHFQCARCAWPLPVSGNDEDLIAWLKEQQETSSFDLLLECLEAESSDSAVRAMANEIPSDRAGATKTLEQLLAAVKLINDELGLDLLTAKVEVLGSVVSEAKDSSEYVTVEIEDHEIFEKKRKELKADYEDVTAHPNQSTPQFSE